MITKEQLQQCLPHNKNIDNWYNSITELLPKYDINTNNRIAAFISQCAHESNDFTILNENLNYNVNTLVKVFPKEFPCVSFARPYIGNKEKIANRLYCNRMGNGNEASGDGYKFHGRGIIQITGRENYEKFSEYCNKPIDEIPDYLETPLGSIDSACWFWKEHNLNELADNKDIKSITKKINGGLLGLDDRISKFNHILAILG